MPMAGAGGLWRKRVGEDRVVSTRSGVTFSSYLPWIVTFGWRTYEQELDAGSPVLMSSDATPTAWAR
jgi:hypothetical protein